MTGKCPSTEAGKIMEDAKTWKFPENISIEQVCEYEKKFGDSDASGRTVFDLTKTVNMHSSFIGFLIHAKFRADRNRGDLKLIVSFTVEKFFIMLNIADYFAGIITVTANKKTA